MGNKHTPIESSAEDKLGRGSFAEMVARGINAARTTESQVFAIYGPWGSGKSSLKPLVLEKLKQKQSEVNYVEFNPWQSGNSDEITIEFFKTVREGLSNSENARAYIANWDGYLSCLKAGRIAERILKATPAGGAVEAVKTIAEGFGANILEEPTIAKQKATLKQAFESLESPLLVIIDDIDRLTTDEICTLFQLIKANADFPKLNYLLLFDREIVELALNKVSSDHGKDYLEKIVQFGFTLPPARKNHLDRIFFAELKDYFQIFNCSELVHMARLSSVHDEVISNYLTTPRKLFRFLEVVYYQLSIHKGESFEANPVDVIILESIKMFEPDAYSRIPRSCSRINARLREDATAFIDDLLKIEKKHNHDRRNYLNILLRSLFGYNNDDLYNPQWIREKKVCSQIHFSRYFHCGLEPDEISDSEIQYFLQLSSYNEIVEQLTKYSCDNKLENAIYLIRGNAKSIPSSNIEMFTRALLNLGEVLDPISGLHSPPEIYLVLIGAIHAVLCKITGMNSRVDTFEISASQSEGLRASLTLSRDIIWLERVYGPLFAHNRLATIRQAIVKKIQFMAQDGSLINHPSLRAALLSWLEWGNEKEAKEFVDLEVKKRTGLLLFLIAMTASHKNSQGGVEYYFDRDYNRLIEPRTLRDQVNSLQKNNLSEEELRAVLCFEKIHSGDKNTPPLTYAQLGMPPQYIAKEE